jgi:hypothetical protein
MGDIFFDNIFTDMAMHDKIQQSAKRLQISHLELREVVTQSLSHLHGLEAQSRSVEGELNGARERLKGVRRGIMERAGESLPVYTGGAPPGYVPPPPVDQAQTQPEGQGQGQGQGQAQGRYYGNPFASSLEQQQHWGSFHLSSFASWDYGRRWCVQGTLGGRVGLDVFNKVVGRVHRWIDTVDRWIDRSTIGSWMRWL